MAGVDITEFFDVMEDDRTGDRRTFHIYCPYVENGRGGRFHTQWRVSGTEEALIGEKGVEKKRQREIDRFHKFLLGEAEKQGEKFELQGKQLWLVAVDSD